jgi:hypothetical protein
MDQAFRHPCIKHWENGSKNMVAGVMAVLSLHHLKYTKIDNLLHCYNYYKFIVYIIFNAQSVLLFQKERPLSVIYIFSLWSHWEILMDWPKYWKLSVSVTSNTWYYHRNNNISFEGLDKQCPIRLAVILVIMSNTLWYYHRNNNISFEGLDKHCPIRLTVILVIMSNTLWYFW